jgi:hypothetical protein
MQVGKIVLPLAGKDGVEVDVAQGDSYTTFASWTSARADLLVKDHSHRNRFLESPSKTVDGKTANVAGCAVVVVPKR